MAHGIRLCPCVKLRALLLGEVARTPSRNRPKSKKGLSLEMDPWRSNPMGRRSLARSDPPGARMTINVSQRDHCGRIALALTSLSSLTPASLTRLRKTPAGLVGTLILSSQARLRSAEEKVSDTMPQSDSSDLRYQSAQIEDQKIGCDLFPFSCLQTAEDGMQQISKLALWPKSFICRNGSWLGHTKVVFLSLAPDATMPWRLGLGREIDKSSLLEQPACTSSWLPSCQHACIASLTRLCLAPWRTSTRITVPVQHFQD